MNVYQKLNAARTKFHSLELKKTGHNKFAGYYYFELGDFLVPALKVFEEVGLCAVVSFDKDRATMEIHDTEVKQMGQGAQSITITSPMGSAALKGCHEVQNIGAVETYQRRYLWVAALEIVEHDALDATTGSEKKERTGVAADVLKVSPQIPGDRQEELSAFAERVVEDFNAYGAQAAFETIHDEGLDDTEKVFISSLMAPNVRNKIKEYSRQFHNSKATA